jgi:hypothetical protein
LSRKLKVEWFAVAFALTAGCPTPNDASTGASDPSSGKGGGGDVDAGADASTPDETQPDGGSGPWVIQRPDGGTTVNPDEEPTCGASSFEAEQVVVEVQVDVPEEITEEVTELVTEEVTEEVTEDVTEEVVTTKPASLYILFDRSKSMNGFGGAEKAWAPAVTALKSFVNDPESDGLGIGIQYFPNGSGACNGNGYKTPNAAVAALPGNAAAINSSLNGQSPNGTGTPIEGALRGATQYCLSFQAANPEEQCVAVIVTDGEPEWDNCEKNYDKLAAIAKDAKDKGVITFAVGLKGANFTLLDKIAQQGGAPDCDDSNSRYACDVSGGADKLNVALAKIRETTVTTETHTRTYPVTRTVTHEVTKPVTRTVTRTEYRTEVQKTPMPCEWNIPESTDGSFDRDKLNVRWSVEEERNTLLRVGSKADCREQAWFYDDPSNPKRVIACDQTCDEIKADVDSTIDILLGCATIVPS